MNTKLFLVLFLFFSTIKPSENDLLLENINKLPKELQEKIFVHSGIIDLCKGIKNYKNFLEESDESFEARLKTIHGSTINGGSDFLYSIKTKNGNLEYGASWAQQNWNILQIFSDSVTKQTNINKVCEIKDIAPSLIGISPNKHYFVFYNPKGIDSKIVVFNRTKGMKIFELGNLLKSKHYIEFHIDGITISNDGNHIAVIDMYSSGELIVDFMMIRDDALIFEDSKLMRNPEYIKMTNVTPRSFSFNQKSTKVGLCFEKLKTRETVIATTPFKFDDSYLKCNSEQALLTKILTGNLSQ